MYRFAKYDDDDFYDVNDVCQKNISSFITEWCPSVNLRLLRV
jgi:hypothetical protein